MRPVEALNAAMRHLGLAKVAARNVADFWPSATRAWRESRFVSSS